MEYKIIGSRERKLRDESGESRRFIVRRLRCTQCKKVHHELPDLMVPYKRYGADVIEEAILINQKVILEHSADEQLGVKDHTLLDSALKRPQQSLFGEDRYPAIHDKVAALLESLAQNHAFHNANKRTALMCTAVFFRYNGYRLRFSSAQIEEDFVVDVVNQRYNLEEIAGTLKENTEMD